MDMADRNTAANARPGDRPLDMADPHTATNA